MYTPSLSYRIGTCKDIKSSHRKLLDRAYRIMEAHYQDEDFDVRKFAIYLAVSRQHLHRVMQACLDLSPTGFVRQFRLERAAFLLKRGDNVTETCFRVGFNHLSYFSRCFQDYFHTKPSCYPTHISSFTSESNHS